jgi:hypothetical protein
MDATLKSVRVEMPVLLTPETEMLGEPVSPVELPLKVVAVATPLTVKPLGKLGAPAPDLFLIVSTFILDIALYLFRYL